MNATSWGYSDEAGAFLGEPRMKRRAFVSGAVGAIAAKVSPRGLWRGFAVAAAVPRPLLSRRGRFAGCFDVRTFGAKGDGQTFDDEAILGAVSAARAAGGGTVVFPPATYRVANGHELTLRDCSDLVLLGPGAVLRNDTDTGSDGGVMTFRGSSKNISVVGLGFETATRNPTSYDNALSFACEPPDSAQNILIRGCRFLQASNKHINIEAPTSNLVIEHCRFEGSLFNSPPRDAPSRYGAIFLNFRKDFQVEIADVTIQDNFFDGNWQFCVAADQYEFPQGRAFLHGIRISDNVFRNSTGGVWARGEYIWIRNNLFDGIGLGLAAQEYEYDSATGRHLARVRARAGQGAVLSNTIALQRAAVIETDGARQVWIENNTFVDCARPQLDGPVRPSDALYVAASGATNLVMTANVAYEASRLASRVPPFHCEVGPGVLCGKNEVVVGQTAPKIPEAPPWPDPGVVPAGVCQAPTRPGD